MSRKKKTNKLYGPVSVIAVLIGIVSLMSLAFSIFGIESYKTVIANGTLETTLITAKNIISLEGIKFLVGSAASNFRTFEPLVFLIISLIGISICEKSGLLCSLFSPFKRVKLSIVLFITLFIGAIGSVIGDYSYIFLIPMVGVAYKYLGKNPLLGILTMFLGITIGYGTGIIFNYNDHLIGLLTEKAATVDVDKTYAFSLLSNLYIMIISTFIICLIGAGVINRFLVPKVSRKYISEDDEYIVSKSANGITLLVLIILIGLIVYSILPLKTFGAGILLDNDASRYMDKLFGNNSPFSNGLVILITVIMIICGFVYGKISGNIKNSHEFSLGLSKNFENLGFMFVLMFFIAQLSSIIEWTNIGNIIGARLIDFMANVQFSGIPLIILFFIVIVLMSILLPGTMDKWNLANPIVIPLFMRSNITPNFTQFIFKVADGVGKCFSPIFVYYIITLAFLEKYRISEKNQVSVFGTLKMMMPVILILTAVWILIICIWYIMGLPIGIGTLSTL